MNRNQGIEASFKPEIDVATLAAQKQYVTFLVDERTYGIDIDFVREIRQCTPITLLPNQDLHIRGVINIRGIIVPLHDIRAKFWSKLTNITENHVVVVVRIDLKVVGILVDSVSNIISIAPEGVNLVPNDKVNNEQSVISGLVKNNEDMVAIIDAGVLFQNT